LFGGQAKWRPEWIPLGQSQFFLKGKLGLSLPAYAEAATRRQAISWRF